MPNLNNFCYVATEIYLKKQYQAKYQIVSNRHISPQVANNKVLFKYCFSDMFY